MRKITILSVLFLLLFVVMGSASANPGAEAEKKLQDNINTVWTLIAAILVFFMQAGFAMLEAGMNTSKTTVNILSKNLMDLSVGVLLFFIVGYGLMYPGDFNGYLGFAQVGIAEFDRKGPG